MNGLAAMRKYVQGEISESALDEAITPLDDDISEFEEDEVFMSECHALALGTIVQDLILGENADRLDEATQEAVSILRDYLVGQGVINEASPIRITNQKINVVHLSKQAQINRLRTIITLKMARKKNHKAYKKYKIGQKIKKKNMEIMKKLFGAKAERLAKKLWLRNKQSGKVNAVVDNAKKKAGAR